MALSLKLFLLLLLLMGFTLITLYLHLQEGGKVSLEELSKLLEATPHLWRRFDIDYSKEDSYVNRVQIQRDWIVGLASTNFIKEAKVKRIFIQHSNPGYLTNTLMSCPYAPEFQDKCQILVKEYKGLKDLFNSTHVNDIPEGIHAVVSQRNGYWGLGLKEPPMPSGVIQVMHTLESPCHSASARLGDNQAWLASYWRGSDIPVYSYVWRKTTGNKPSKWEEPLGRKGVVALMSNCDLVKNGRMALISQLKRWIHVDVYGACGDKKCPEDCQRFLGQRYKFFLAFENCNCVDYITEKMSVNALMNQMIPVVMGAPKANYEMFAPPSSFIHVDDFKSVEELGRYLKHLDGSPREYFKYFEWLGSWRLATDVTEDFLCRLCGMLFYNDFIPAPKWPSRFTTWANVNRCTMLPNNTWN